MRQILDRNVNTNRGYFLKRKVFLYKFYGVIIREKFSIYLC